MAKTSKVTTGRLKVAGSVIAALGAQSGAIVTAMHANAGAPPVGLAAQIMGWLLGTLTSATEELRTADLAHAAESDDDHEPRERRDSLERRVRGMILSGADAVRGVYGLSFSKSLGLESALPERPDQLQHHAESVASNLATQTAPAPISRGASLDLNALAADIDRERLALRVALDTVAREARELQATKSARDLATARWTRTYAGVSTIFSGMATLAGLDDLASKVKPTERRRSGLEEPIELEAEPTEPAEPS